MIWIQFPFLHNQSQRPQGILLLRASGAAHGVSLADSVHRSLQDLGREQQGPEFSSLGAGGWGGEVSEVGLFSHLFPTSKGRIDFFLQDSAS